MVLCEILMRLDNRWVQIYQYKVMPKKDAWLMASYPDCWKVMIASVYLPNNAI